MKKWVVVAVLLAGLLAGVLLAQDQPGRGIRGFYPIYAADFGPRNSATLTNVLARIGTSRWVTVVLDGGPWTITENIVVPSNVELLYARGTRMVMASGVTVTVNTEYDSTLTAADVVARSNMYGCMYWVGIPGAATNMADLFYPRSNPSGFVSAAAASWNPTNLTVTHVRVTGNVQIGSDDVQCDTNVFRSMVGGVGVMNYANDSLVFGLSTTNWGRNNVVLGDMNSVFGTNNVVLGDGISLIGSNSLLFAVGLEAKAILTNSIMFKSSGGVYADTDFICYSNIVLGGRVRLSNATRGSLIVHADPINTITASSVMGSVIMGRGNRITQAIESLVLGINNTCERVLLGSEILGHRIAATNITGSVILNPSGYDMPVFNVVGKVSKAMLIHLSTNTAWTSPGQYTLTINADNGVYFGTNRVFDRNGNYLMRLQATNVVASNLVAGNVFGAEGNTLFISAWPPWNACYEDGRSGACVMLEPPQGTNDSGRLLLFGGDSSIYGGEPGEVIISPGYQNAIGNKIDGRVVVSQNFVVAKGIVYGISTNNYIRFDTDKTQIVFCVNGVVWTNKP